ncbi:MAG TPA: tetratricopeptide repeat protein [Candidatus Xenobia bacterium]|jgi:hypothetical protein
MITPGKREKEKRRKEKQQTKLAAMARNAANRDMERTAAWPPDAGSLPNWPTSRTQPIVDELVSMVGPEPPTAWRTMVRRIASNPGDLSGYRTLGLELLSEGNIPAALGVFNIVIREFPHHPLGPWKYAVCLRTKGDLAACGEWMQRAWRRAQELPRAIDAVERAEFDRDAQLAGLKVS